MQRNKNQNTKRTTDTIFQIDRGFGWVLKKQAEIRALLSIKKNSAGFTLIELLLVISIISLLSSIVLVSVAKTRMKARDAKRVEDLVQLSKAMEMYSLNNGENYPPDLGACDTSMGLYPLGYPCSGTITGGPSWPLGGLSDMLAKGVVSKMPADPTNSGDYFYYYEPVYAGQTQFSVTCVNTTCAYIISAKLEDPSSPLLNPGCNQAQVTHNYCIAGGGAKFGT